MPAIALTFSHVLYLLPALSPSQLGLISDACPGITCVASGEKGQRRFRLTAQLNGRTVGTGEHDRIGPGLVEALACQLERQLEWQIQ